MIINMISFRGGTHTLVKNLGYDIAYRANARARICVCRPSINTRCMCIYIYIIELDD